MKFEVGAAVFFYTILGRVPGVVLSAEQDADGKWLYQIETEKKTWINVPEKEIKIRTMSGEHIYREGDKVEFLDSDGETKNGTIIIVDAYGTFVHPDEVCYDIMNKEKDELYKHIREADVVGRL